jgi:membrane protease YdiL (CAAX protease family)
MFITQAFKPNNEFWRYLLGSVAIILASFIGQIPLVIAIAIKTAIAHDNFPVTNEALMTYLEPNLTLFLILISFVFAMGAIYLVVKYFHRQTFREVTTGRKKTDWNRILFSFTIWALFSIITTLIAYYLHPENFVLNFKPIPFAILAVIAILMIPIQTSTEEYVFRGYLMQGFAILAKNKWFPLLMTSLIFGTMHIMNPEVEKMGYIIMFYYIGTGLFLGILTLMDDGIELALGFHAANNLVSALLVTSDWSAFQTHSVLKDVSEPTAGFDVILPVVIIFPILLFIFSKKYNWSGWKEKLTGKIVTPFNS